MPGTWVAIEAGRSTQKMSAGDSTTLGPTPRPWFFDDEEWRSRFAGQHHRAAPVIELGGAS